MKNTQSGPAKVSRNTVKNHFQKAYSLSEEQAEIMLSSSAQSLNSFLSALTQIAGNEEKLAEIARLGHSLKGVLLNMGEERWADLARSLECWAAAGESRDYEKIVAAIRLGMEDVMRGNGGNKDTT